MERYIHVDTLIDYIDWDNDIQKWTLRKEPEDIPAADVELVRYGTWISFLDGDSIMPERYYRCSRCGRVEGREEPYCHCGARMSRQ